MMPLVLIAAMLQASTAMRPIDRGPQSGITEPRQVTVRSAAEWESLWQMHAPQRPLPPIEFARDMVVGVFLGSRPTAGYTVDIARVRDEGGTTIVEYRETLPRPDAILAQVLTAPFVLVAIPARGGDVRFEKVKS